MLKELDNRINKALIFLSNAKDCTATTYEIEPDRESTSNVNIVKFLIELDLAFPVQANSLSPDCCRISKKGIDIIKSGGWLKNLGREKIKLDKADKKLEYDLKISRIKLNTYVPVMVLGAFGGIYSGYQFMKDLGVLGNRKETITQMERNVFSDFLHSPDNQKTDSLLYTDQLEKGVIFPKQFQGSSEEVE